MEEQKHLCIFNFNNSDITIIGDSEDPWFIANEIAEIFKISNIRQNLLTIPESWRSSVCLSYGSSGSKKTTIINELAVYRIAMRSNKPNAIEFQNRVAEILRELRKNGKYEMEQKLMNTEQKHKQEIEKISRQLKEKDNLNFTLKNFVENVKMKEKNQVIYIATTRMYAKQNIFKVGGVCSETKLQNRLSQYNSGRIEGDYFYYGLIVRCNNFHHMESRIKEILSEFRYNKEREMYVLNYGVLQEIITFLVENYNNEIDRLNEFMSNILQNMSKMEPIIPEPILLRDTIQIKRICNGSEVETKTIDLDNLSESERENVVNRLVETFMNECQSNTINRKEFESYVLEKKEISFKKMTLWKTLKNISKRLSILRLEYI